jgi:hypothetical protein
LFFYVVGAFGVLAYNVDLAFWFSFWHVFHR